jgi:antitoxin YefM
MQTLPLAEVHARLSALVDEVNRTAERVTITRNGVPVAVVLSVDDLAALEVTLAWLESPEVVRRAAEADEAVAAGDVTGRRDGGPHRGPVLPPQRVTGPTVEGQRYELTFGAVARSKHGRQARAAGCVHGRSGAGRHRTSGTGPASIGILNSA